MRCHYMSQPRSKEFGLAESRGAKSVLSHGIIHVCLARKMKLQRAEKKEW